MIQILKTIKKLFQKRYSVVIFDSHNPPIAGDTFTVDDLIAEFKEQKTCDILEVEKKTEKVEPVWVCRKCGFREQKK
jgi:hypothetical protein